MSLFKVHSIVDRLITKMEMSQTPIPGFVMGLSGTDSVLAFHICYEALSHFGMGDTLLGINFCDYAERPKKFEAYTIPWLKEKYPKAQISIVQPQGGDYDPYRWAHIHRFATTQNKWTVGSINATEHYLGKYTLLHNACSVQPIRSIWKSEVMAACEELEVPQSLLESSRSPDEVCGRDKIAAENIEAIDDIIRFKPTDIDFDLRVKLSDYIRQTKAENDFRARVPYTI
jgi:NH3-dependent NAD+ synthetase